MNLVLQLTPATEAKLRAQASREGRQPEAIALEALEERLDLPAERPGGALTPDEWARKVRSVAAALPHGNPNADFSRESIYEGRGE